MTIDYFFSFSLGIGRGITVELSKCGAKVVALSRTKADLDSLKQQVCVWLFYVIRAVSTEILLRSYYRTHPYKCIIRQILSFQIIAVQNKGGAGQSQTEVCI